MIGIVFALSAALSWGAGDFSGGLATRKMNQFQILFISSISSLILLILFSILRAEDFPSTRNIIIAIFAGLSGALGLATLYKGLSLGYSVLVAPVAGVIGAIIPTLAGLIIEGLPSIITLTGFVLTVVGIWLISRSKEANGQNAQDGLGFALLAGIGFGGFLALIAQIDGDQIITPLVFAKSASLILALFLVQARRLAIPNPIHSPGAILSGFLDAGGNILYIFAAQFARLDTAAVLSSLYPAATVMLSRMIMKEEITLSQWLGAITCIAAIMLITIG